MNPLSLDHINELSPYYVMLSPKDNYIFETERDIHYSISFEEETPIVGCDSYQFIIEKIDKVRSSDNSEPSQILKHTICGVGNSYIEYRGSYLNC